VKTATVAIALLVLCGCMVRWYSCGPKPKEDINIVGFNDKMQYTCTIERARNVNRCTIKEIKSGKVLCERDFRVQPGNRLATDADFGTLVAFDGENLRVRNGSGYEVTLVPLLACKAED
jgi:hypothetical protein